MATTTNLGPNNQAVWTPVPFPDTYPSNTSGGSIGDVPGGGTPGGGTPGGGTPGNGNVYAAALFFAATCQSSDVLGAFVRAADGTNAVTTTSSSSGYPAIGVIVAKSSATACTVQTYGLCGGIYSGLTPNYRYFVGPNGQPALYTELPKTARYVQAIGFAVRSNFLFVQPSGSILTRDTSAGSTPPEDDDGDTVSPYAGGILHGTGAPDEALGQPGDSYLEYDAYLLWGPKTDAGWGTAGKPLIGPKGDAGTPGNRIRSRVGPPESTDAGIPGDQLFDRYNGVLYEFT